MAYVYPLSGGLGLAWSDVQAAAQKAASQVQVAVQQATSKPSSQAVVTDVKDSKPTSNAEGMAAYAENTRLRSQLGLQKADEKSWETVDQILADNAQMRMLLAQRAGVAVGGGGGFPVLPAVGLGLVALFLLKGK
jgi:hypothetical protein